MISTQLGGIASWLGSMLNGLVEKILSIFITPLAMLLYSLQIGFFWLIDCIQGIFRSMAGLGTYYFQGEEQSGDIVMSILTSDIIMTIFWSVLVVAIMLLFVTTFVAIIRVEFTEKGAGNAKGPIIGRAIKSLAYFAIVPVVCLFGIWISNVFLRSLDAATSNQSYALSTTVFFAASHDGNRARTDSAFAEKIKTSDIGEYLGLKGTNATQEEVALAIDNAFLQRKATPGDHNLSIEGEDHMFTVRLIKGGTLYSETFDTNNFSFTYYFYDLFLGYNYLIGFMGGFVAASLLLTSCIALIQRLYELAILFVISPTTIAFMPIDDGKKYGQWRGEFIKRVASMYGPVIGLNLMFIILAVLRDVDIFHPDTGIYAVFNSIVQLIFLIVGLLAVKEFSSLISGLVGSEDAIGKGESKKENVQKMVDRTAAGSVNAARFGSQAMKATKGTLKSNKWLQDNFGKSDDERRRAIQQDLASGKYRRREITDEKGNVVDSRYEKKHKFARWKNIGLKDLDASEVDAAHIGETAKDIYGQKHNDDKNASWGAQAKLITRGEGYKTELGTTWDLFMEAGGKDLQRYATRKGVAEGKGLTANLPIWKDWGEKGATRQNMAQWDARKKKAKEDKDALEDKQQMGEVIGQVFGREDTARENDPKGQAFAGRFSGPIDVRVVGGTAPASGGSGGVQTSNTTGGSFEGDSWREYYGDSGVMHFDGLGGSSTTTTQPDTPQVVETREEETAGGVNPNTQNVNIVGDQTQDEQKIDFDPAVIASLNNAIWNLRSAAQSIKEAGERTKESAIEMKNATREMQERISAAAKDLPEQVFKGIKENKNFKK